MEVFFNGFNKTTFQFVLLVLLICSQAESRSLRRGPICVSEKINVSDFLDRCRHFLTRFDQTHCQEQQSFMWTIKRNPPSYFFGTIHVPYTKVWDSIPQSVKEAFESSDSVFFELDLMDPFTVSRLAKCQMLPQGKKLMDVLPRDLYRRLKGHLEYVRGILPTWITADQRGRGLYAEYLFKAITGNWERKRPVWVMLMVNSLTESDIKSRGIPVLDLYLAQEAQRLNKNMGSVEKVEEQCVPLNGLNFPQVIFALNQTLNQHENIRNGRIRPKLTTDDLIKHYNCGDLNEIIFNQDLTYVPKLLNNSTMIHNSLDLETAQFIDDYFKAELIIKRNQRMSQRVLQLLNANPEQSFFFAFGAGHFLGNNSILNFIQDAGFDVVRMTRVNINDKTKIKNYKNKVGCRSRSVLQHQQKENYHRQPHRQPQQEQQLQIQLKLQQHHHRRRQHTSEYVFNTQNTIGKTLADYSMRPNSDSNILLINAQEKHRQHQLNGLSVDNKIFGRFPSDIISSGKPETLSTQSIVPLKTSTTSSFLIQRYSSSKHRKFNDLWVRLETVTTRKPLLIPRQEMAKDVEAVHKHLQAWHSIASDSLAHINYHSQLFVILISYINTLIVLISYLNRLSL